MKRQWRKFLRNAEKNQLYKAKIEYYAVPLLATYLDKSIKKDNKKDIESILKTLEKLHNITLDEKGNLCFIKENKSEVRRWVKRSKEKGNPKNG